MIMTLSILQPHFARLGIRVMLPADFRQGLLNMDEQIRAQSDHWHEQVCSQLYVQEAIYQAVYITDLKIIPLQSGAWTSVGSAGALFSTWTVAAFQVAWSYRVSR